MNPSDPPPPASTGGPRRDGLADRTGYDETFLGPVVPLPLPVRPSVETVILPYTHFTVAFRPDRRLAASTAVCVEGRALMEDVPGDDVWEFDPRLPEERQAGDAVYRDGGLAPGHLVRPLSPAWGPSEVALRARADSFRLTNAAPRPLGGDGDARLWQGLEGHLLDDAAEFDRKLIVLTGPVLLDSDPSYRGLRVPLRFWKVAAFMRDGALAACAFVLDQGPGRSRDAERARAGARAGAPEEAPPLGPSRTYQVPVSDVAELTELEFGPLPDLDVLPPPRGPEDSWRRLESYGDIALHP